MRVFLDTNVLASAFSTRGLCEDVFSEILRSHELVITPPLFVELGRVLRAKFNIPKNLVSEILAFLKEDTILAKVGTLPKIKIKDRDDVALISCALEGGADVFITGDNELLELGRVDNLEILSPRAFWKKLKESLN